MSNAFHIFIATIGEVLSLLIIVDSLLSFVLPISHPLREAIGRILQPMYAPIRRIIPTAGMFDFSPIVLLLLIQLVVGVLNSIV
jgi:YggT family protein